MRTQVTGKGEEYGAQVARITVPDLDGAIELCYTNGWTDGLPVIPPTEERIEAMLAAAGLEPGSSSRSSRTGRSR